MRNPLRESVFHFKQFDVSNSQSAMKVGTDGVLLGAWTPLPERVNKILDVGCGTGLIALMMAQRCRSASILGVEIDENAVTEARKNVANSPFSDRISIECADFIEFHSEDRFDVIVSNPPFFTETLHSPDAKRADARHESSMPLEQMMRTAAQLLSEDGILSLVLPATRDADLEFQSAICGLYPSMKCSVSTSPSKPPKRTLWAMTRKPAECRSSTLSMRDISRLPTPEYIALVDEFYTKIS